MVYIFLLKNINLEGSVMIPGFVEMDSDTFYGDIWHRSRMT